MVPALAIGAVAFVLGIASFAFYTRRLLGRTIRGHVPLFPARTDG